MRLFSRFDYGIASFPMLILILVTLNMTIITFKIRIFSRILISIKRLIEEFFLRIKSKGFNKIISIILLSSFLILLLLNFSAVLSYNFALTTQLRVLIYLSLSLWVSFILFMVKNSTKRFLSHCIPEGTPIYLVWFLFLIELISNSIRPMTVTVRLLANITAGHLLIILLARLVEKFYPAILAYVLLNIVEIFVALIQSYIYATIIRLYYSEVK